MGADLYDKNYQITPNGSGLLGHWSSTQSAMFIPKPGNPDVHYLFTVGVDKYEEPEYTGLNYSIINKCENNGKGDIIEGKKNILLLKNTAEKMAATSHANGTDVWVVTIEIGTSNLNAYLVTDEGVNPTPVVSDAGYYFDLDYEIVSTGQLSFSLDGTKFVMALKNCEYVWNGATNLGHVRIYDFDNATGKFTKTEKNISMISVYGVALSPDNRYLYATCYYDNIFAQWDLNYEPVEDIILANKLIFSKPRHSEESDYRQALGVLQYAPDGNLYTAGLHYIKHPDSIASKAGFVLQKPFPLPIMTRLGLPNFNQSYFDRMPRIYAHQVCHTNEINFTLSKPDSVASVDWNFDDDSGEVKQNVSSSNIIYRYSKPGKYKVTADIHLNSGKVIRRNFNAIVKNYNVDIGPDTVICNANKFILDATQNEEACYQWMNGETTPKITTATSGWHWVEVRKAGCTKRDSAFVKFHYEPITNLPEEVTACAGDEVLLTAKTNEGEYTWSDGTKSNELITKDEGEFWLTVENELCSITDTIRINRMPYADKLFSGPDTLICKNQSITFSKFQYNVNYFWNGNSNTNLSRPISEPGKYWLTSKLGDCERTDTLNVYSGLIPSELDTRKMLCIGESLKLEENYPTSDYLWSTGSQEYYIEVQEPGNYSLEISNECFVTTKNFKVVEEECDCEIFIPNVITLNGDGKNDAFTPITHQRIKEYELKIFNRWGQTVNQLKGTNQIKWDGLQNGNELSTGVYFYELKYICEFQDESKQVITKSGYIHLIR
ncbi:MAG: gliding motility-associated C-terminal domain-containing protein [Cyclobacteriaceae bacterium]|nr:gliding motility-associated C-terminal domain-containing protein [Cyclobacteriaceae bacterium]